MGFETNNYYSGSDTLANLNFVPMGFETFICNNCAVLNFIWTLSLWDLKQDSIC